MDPAKLDVDSDQLELLKRINAITEDPMEFFKAIRTKDQVDKKNPVKRFPYELSYLRTYIRLWQTEKLILVPKSRRMIMSWTNVCLFLWDTMWNIGRHQAFVSKKEDDANELVERAYFVLENLDKTIIPRDIIPKYKLTYCKLHFPEIDSTIQGFPQGADQLRQFTFSGILADEMAFWPDAQEMYAASFPTLEGGGRFTAISSPGPGFFKSLVFDQLDSHNV